MRIPLVASALAFVVAFNAAVVVHAADSDSRETRREQEAALAAELVTLPPLAFPAEPLPLGDDFPLFIGVDDTTISTYRIEVPGGAAAPQFTGFQAWGAAYDANGDQVYFNNGSQLFVWPVGGAPTLVGTITDGANPLSFVALAWYDGVLYGARNIANEAVYTIDTTSLVATVHIDYLDADFDLGGLAIDQATGEIYATNDDATPFGSGLYRINLNATGTLIAAYPAGQTDIDGLAVGGGSAFLVTDEPGDIFVWSFAGGAYTTPIPNPWTTSEVFASGAWIEPVATMPFLDGFESEDTSAWSLTQP